MLLSSFLNPCWLASRIGSSSFVFVFGVERADRLELHANRLHDATVAECVRFAVGQTGTRQQSEHSRLLLVAGQIGVASLHVVTELGHLQKVEYIAICNEMWLEEEANGGVALLTEFARSLQQGNR